MPKFRLRRYESKALFTKCVAGATLLRVPKQRLETRMHHFIFCQLSIEIPEYARYARYR